MYYGGAKGSARDVRFSECGLGERDTAWSFSEVLNVWYAEVAANGHIHDPDARWGHSSPAPIILRIVGKCTVVNV